MTRSRNDRLESAALVAILLIVAGFAGAASFTHVKDWTLDNSPAGKCPACAKRARRLRQQQIARAGTVPTNPTSASSPRPTRNGG
ncbi:hypothetical protein [Micromonospora sp. WMMD736]|uniref:hypothetical protein n=1 Tax=Micromonospora sp. WMMD736 TaxID=3404112 RepID=UPI003B94510F